MEKLKFQNNKTTHNDLTFFTNEVGASLYYRFRTTLKFAKYFDVLVGYFRTSGFYRLYDSFRDIEKIRILVGTGTNSKTVEFIEEAKQLNCLETHNKTKSIFSEEVAKEIAISEDTYEVEEGIKNFIALIKNGKLEIKAYPSKDIHAKVYITRFNEDGRDYGRVITGSSNFSESGLNGNYEFNVELKNRCDVEYALDKFEYLWQQAVDLSAEYIDTINNKTWLNNDIMPYELYLKFLYEYFCEEINADESQHIYLPENFLDLKYQSQAVATLKKIVDQYNGAFISDVVGLGKTYMTAMYAQGLPGKKLVICPPPILDSWKDAFINFGVQSYEIESIGKIDKIVNKIRKMDENKYDYIFVDEAHRFRNDETEQYRLLHELCFDKKVLLITATPLNNTFYDFLSLLKLFQNPTNSDIPGITNLKTFFDHRKYKLVQTEKEYGKDSEKYLEEVKNVSREVRDKVLKYVMVRRTRTDIIKYFSKDIEQQGLFFPKVGEPKRIIYKFDSKTNAVFEDTIHAIKNLSFARYTPGLYLKQEKQISAFEKQQEVNLKGFMKTLIIKRFESSKYAFELTLERIIRSHKKFIKMFEKGTVYISKDVDVYEYLDNDSIDDLEKLLEGGEKAKVKKFSSDAFEEKFLILLKQDLNLVNDIYQKWKKIEKDLKLEKFLYKIQSDKVLKANKVIIFTESKETGDYLFTKLNKIYHRKVIFYSSSNCRIDDDRKPIHLAREIIKENFDPGNKFKANDLRILVTTDVLAEGINLHRSNIVINYDLPWNPTRILQRVGRINRVGTKHKEVYIYNFFPTSESEEQIGLEENIKAKIQAFHNALGEDAKYLSEEEEFTSFNLRGADLYNKLNSAKTFEEDEEENIELKYLAIIRDLRDNQTELFNKIKHLPRKIRTCRDFQNIEKDNLITFFRKGKLQKFCITSGTVAVELGFDQAVKYFECEESTSKKVIPKEYYGYLEINKNIFRSQIDEEDLPEKQRGGKSREKTLIVILKALLKEKRFTNEELEYIKNVLKAFSGGLIPRKISKIVNDEVSKVTDNLKILPILKENIQEIYLNRGSQNNKRQNNIREIILSEYLLKE